MLSDTYKGDSAAKKLVRWDYWRTINHLKRNGTHMYLGSREMGDYRILNEYGMISVGAEIDDEAYAAAAAKFPGAYLFNGDVADIAEMIVRDGCSISSVLLDFCCQISDIMLRTAVRVGKLLPPGSLIGIGYQRGREQAGRVSIQSPYTVNRRARRRFVSNASGEEKELAKDWINGRVKKMINRDRTGEKAIEGSEINGRDETIRALMMLQGVFANPVRNWEYQSKTKESNGIPMAYTLFEIVPYERLGGDIHRYPSVYWEADDDLIKREALRLSGKGWPADRVAAILNLNSGTVAAWKAHDTMYRNKELPSAQ